MQPDEKQRCKCSRPQSPTSEESISSFTAPEFPEVVELSLHSLSFNYNSEPDFRVQHECAKRPSILARAETSCARDSRQASSEPLRPSLHNSYASFGSLGSERRSNVSTVCGDEVPSLALSTNQERRKRSRESASSGTQPNDCKASTHLNMILDLIPWIVVTIWILITWLNARSSLY